MRRKAQTEGRIAGLRRKYPVKPGRGLPRIRRGRSGRSAREAARCRGTVCRPPFRRPSALHCRAGVHARRGGLRRPGRVLARQGAAPLSRLTPTAPLAGEPFRRQFPKASPARGGGCAARRRRRGALPLCGGDTRQSPAGPCPASVGDDLHAKGRYFVLCALKRRLRAAMLASSRNPCDAANPMRRAKSPALQSRRERAATHKRQPSAKPAGGSMQVSAPTQGTEQPVGAGSCPTPGHRLPSPVPPPVCLAL